MQSVVTRVAAVLATLGAALFLSSCTGPAPEGQSGQPAGFNADDLAFTTGMIPHHQQAVQMSAMVPTRSTNPEVIRLAGTISAAQGPEIETMKGLLAKWNQTHDTETGHGGHGSMQGMVDDSTMAKLATLGGTEFDALWLKSMIDHHRGAVEMAKAEIANGEDVDAVALAKTIVDTQQAEIGQMNEMLGQ
jgi:uncharacterized protein (DUF305 family)